MKIFVEISSFSRNILEEYQRDRPKLLSIRRSLDHLEEYGEEESPPVKISSVKLLAEMFEES